MIGHRRVVVAVFAGAALMRLAFLAAKPQSRQQELLTPDEFEYHGIATSVMSGGGYRLGGIPTAQRMPGYPLFLATVYALVGISPPAARVAQALVGAGLCVVLACIAGIAFGRKAAWAAGCIGALYYPFIQLPLYLLSENMYLFIFTLAVLHSWSAVQRGQADDSGGEGALQRLAASATRLAPLRLSLVGVVWGLAALVRPLALPLGLLVATWVGVRRGWVSMSILVVAMGATLVPWAVRNYGEFGRLMPGESRSGAAMYLAFGPPGPGGVLGHWNWGSDVERPVLPPGMTGAERDREYMRLAAHNLKADPGQVLRRAPRKLLNLLTPFYGTASAANKVVATACYVTVYLLGVLGILTALRRGDMRGRRLTELFGVVGLFTFAFHAITFGVVRYRYPVDALMVVFAGGWLGSLGGDSDGDR